ncbi:MAG: hypothetical protein ACRDJN_16110 [Chloroflexota bacterium]
MKGTDDAPEPTVQIGTVRYNGAFQPVEREFLAGQFSRCVLTLLARSAQDARLALVQWEGSPAELTGRGPGPLTSAPRRAAYVLDTTGGAQSAGSVAATSRAAGPTLVRVDSEADLEIHYPGYFPGARLRLSWWDRARRFFRGTRPAFMLVVISAWLLAIVWACRTYG